MRLSQTNPGGDTPTTKGFEEKDGLCGICPAGCWVRVTVEDGRIVQCRANPDHPLGMICINGRHAPEVVHDPMRLRHPMRRIGPKGTQEFERISWDEAYDLMVDRLETIKAESGAEATAIYTGRGAFELSLCDIFQPGDVAVSSASSILFPFGSPNTLGVGALCYVSFAMIAPHVTMGEMYITTEPDIDQAQLIVVWGANPATDSPPRIHQQIKRAHARGAEVVVIDPQRNHTAQEVGAQWVPIRPGTDGALALGLLQVLMDEELFDEEFVTHWTVGWEPLRQMVQHYPPDVVEEITGVPAETVRDLARRIARVRGAAPVMYTGLEYSDSGVQAIRAVLTLWAVAGQLDVPGGLLLGMKSNQFPINREGLVHNPDVRRALGRERFPLYSEYRGESHAIALPDAVLRGDPYPIRALIIQGGSILTAWPNPGVWRETLGALDFLVCIDRHLTADAAYADLVLPATTMFEVSSYMTYGPLFKLRERMIEPVGEARDDFLILAELARRLGYGDRYPDSEEARLHHVLEGSGFTLEEVREAGGEVRIPTAMMEYKKWEKGLLRPDGKPGFDTPSGKFEIASTILAEHGYDALPTYTEPRVGPLSQPRLAGRYPLVFNSGTRPFGDFRSQHHGVPELNRLSPEPTVTMNTEDAKARGIGNGSGVFVETPSGRVRFRAVVTDNIVRGAVDANMGGGGPLGPPAWRDANVNELTDLEHFDQISGFPIYKALLCEVVPAGEDRDGIVDNDPVPTETWASETEPPSPGLYRDVYLDHNATTPVHPEVLEAMLPFLKEQLGNPSSIYSRGNEARDALEDARRKVARSLNCTARRIVFTGGGSEADNLAIKGVALALRERGRHIVTTAIEHPAVLNTCRDLEPLGFETTVLPVDNHSRVDPAHLADALRPDTILVSVMLANNETGTLQPVQELAAIAHERDVLIHCDAIQALGKVSLDVETLGVDLLSLSAHKAHAPKGVGALYVRNGVTLSPLVSGGGQERSLRSGTENVPGIVAFGRACDLAEQWLAHGRLERVAELRDGLERAIAELWPEAHTNGCREARLPNTLNMTLPGMRGESLVLVADRYGVHFSSGSACKSGNPTPSHVLTAMGLSDEEAHCTVRLSLGVDTDQPDIDHTVEVLRHIIEDSRTTVRFVTCR